jgi:membrane protein DedA with SNARE-associated domain
MHVSQPTSTISAILKQTRHYKCWKVTGILPWSALLFVIGYVFREYGAFHFDNIDVFIVSLVFIYAAP